MAIYNEYSEQLKERENRLLEREIQTILNENGNLLQPYHGLLEDIGARNQDAYLLTLKSQLESAIPHIKTVDSNLNELTAFENTEQVAGGISDIRSECHTVMTVVNVNEFVQKTNTCVANCRLVRSILYKNNKIKECRNSNQELLASVNRINGQIGKIINQTDTIAKVNISDSNIELQDLSAEQDDIIKILDDKTKMDNLHSLVSQLGKCVPKWHYGKDINNHIEEVNRGVRDDMTLYVIDDYKDDVSELFSELEALKNQRKEGFIEGIKTCFKWLGKGIWAILVLVGGIFVVIGNIIFSGRSDD